VSKKWLLDHNLPKQLAEFLRTKGIECSWTSAEGWQTLANGALVRAASDAGYVCLLTNDRKFANAAGNALTKNPSFSVIEITIPQAPKVEFLNAITIAWAEAPIEPQSSKVVKWPL
jgi:predicted nuclease of predicted toxin-antitoxin system